MASSFPYSKVLINNYLGITKTIKARTIWELNLKEAQERKKWSEQEARKREKELIEDLKEKTDYMNSEC